MPLKTVLFDMGNVLVNFCHERMCRQIGELCGRSGQDIRRHLLESELQWNLERGLLDESAFHARLQQSLQAELDISGLKRAAADIFHLNESILPVLDSLRDQGLRLVLMSNTSVTHYNWVRANYRVLDRFHHLVMSFEVGAIKPEDGIYQAALAAIACAPAECLYVDDIPGYVEKGRTFGLQAELFIDTPGLIHHLRARGIELSPAQARVNETGPAGPALRLSPKD